jgi:hypothetical protein
MLGSSTTPDRDSARHDAEPRVAFRPLNSVGIRDVISWLNTQPGGSPVNASTCASRRTPHDSGPVWFATPSLHWTCTNYPLPVSRRSQSGVGGEPEMLRP